MYICPQCGGRTVEATRVHTLYETMTLCYTDEQGSYEEEDAGSFGDSLDQGGWKERTCVECGTKWPDEPASAPQPTVHIVFGSERYLCGVYRSRDAAEAAVRAKVPDVTEAPEGSEDWQLTYEEYEIVEMPLE